MGAGEFFVDVEAVGALAIDVVVLRGGEVSGCVVGDLVSGGPELVDAVADVERVPVHDGVGDDREAQRLFELFVGVSAAHVALVAEEQASAQGLSDPRCKWSGLKR